MSKINSLFIYAGIYDFAVYIYIDHDLSHL